MFLDHIETLSFHIPNIIIGNLPGHIKGSIIYFRLSCLFPPLQNLTVILHLKKGLPNLPDICLYLQPGVLLNADFGKMICPCEITN